MADNPAPAGATAYPGAATAHACLGCGQFVDAIGFCNTCRDEGEGNVEAVDGNDEAKLSRASTDGTAAKAIGRANSELAGNVLLQLGGPPPPPRPPAAEAGHDQIPVLPLAVSTMAVQLHKWSAVGSRATSFFQKPFDKKSVFSSGRIVAEMEEASGYLGGSKVSFLTDCTVHCSGLALRFGLGDQLPMSIQDNPMRNKFTIYAIVASSAGVAIASSPLGADMGFDYTLAADLLEASQPDYHVDQVTAVAWAKTVGEDITRRAALVMQSGATVKKERKQRGLPVEQSDSPSVTSNRAAEGPKELRAQEVAAKKALEAEKSKTNKLAAEHKAALKLLNAEIAGLQRELGKSEGENKALKQQVAKMDKVMLTKLSAPPPSRAGNDDEDELLTSKGRDRARKLERKRQEALEVDRLRRKREEDEEEERRKEEERRNKRARDRQREEAKSERKRKDDEEVERAKKRRDSRKSTSSSRSSSDNGNGSSSDMDESPKTKRKGKSQDRGRSAKKEKKKGTRSSKSKKD